MYWPTASQVSAYDKPGTELHYLLVAFLIFHLNSVLLRETIFHNLHKVAEQMIGRAGCDPWAALAPTQAGLGVCLWVPCVVGSGTEHWEFVLSLADRPIRMEPMGKMRLVCGNDNSKTLL